MTTKTFFRAPWRAACWMSLLFIGISLSSCSSDDSEVEPDPDPNTETPEATLDPLFTAKVPGDLGLLVQYDHGVIFASDDAGNVLAAQEFHKGDDLSVKPDQAYAGKSFTLTVFYVSKSPSNTNDYSTQAYTYTNVPRGVQWNDLGQVLPPRYPTKAGTIQATVTKSPEWNGNYLYLATDYRYETTGFESNNLWNQEVTLGASNSMVAWDESPEGYRFAVYENLTPGQTIAIHTDDLTQVMKKESVPVPDNTRTLSIRLWGKPDVNENTVNYYIGGTYQQNADSYSVQYPAIDLFKTFDGTTDLWTEDYDLHTSHHGTNKYDITPIDHKFSWTANQASSINFSTATDAMDNVQVQWTYGEPGPNPYGFGYWFVYAAPGNDRVITLPTLPTVLTNLISNTGFRERFVRSTVTFGAYDRVNGYAEWLTLGTGAEGSIMNAYRGGKDWKEMVLSLKK